MTHPATKRPLAATSWLWPTALAENLRRISSWNLPIRQVALLFYQFGSSLAYTRDEFISGADLDCHVHLPLDLPWQEGPRAVWSAIVRLMELPCPLSPWSGVLHPPDEPSVLAGVGELWRKAQPGWRLLLENIPGQDLRAHWPVIEALDLPVCLDVGHLMAFGQHWLLDQPGLPGRVELIHCYAPGLVPNRHRHLELSALSPAQAATLKRILEMLKPETPVLFEVFSETDLLKSLETFYGFIDDWGMRR